MKGKGKEKAEVKIKQKLYRPKMPKNGQSSGAHKSSPVKGGSKIITEVGIQTEVPMEFVVQEEPVRGSIIRGKECMEEISRMNMDYEMAGGVTTTNISKGLREGPIDKKMRTGKKPKPISFNSKSFFNSKLKLSTIASLTERTNSSSPTSSISSGLGKEIRAPAVKGRRIGKSRPSDRGKNNGLPKNPRSFPPGYGDLVAHVSETGAMELSGGEPQSTVQGESDVGTGAMESDLRGHVNVMETGGAQAIEISHMEEGGSGICLTDFETERQGNGMALADGSVRDQ